MSFDKAILIEKIESAISTVRPHLNADGGDIEVVDVTEDYHVKVKWIGACESCSMSTMTLRAGIEHTIKSKIPEIISVEAING